MKLTHKQVSSKGGTTTALRYPKAVRIEWAKKAAKARWSKHKTMISNCCSAPLDEFEICTHCKEPSEAVESE